MEGLLLCSFKTFSSRAIFQGGMSIGIFGVRQNIFQKQFGRGRSSKNLFSFFFLGGEAEAVNLVIWLETLRTLQTLWTLQTPGILPGQVGESRGRKYPYVRLGWVAGEAGAEGPSPNNVVMADVVTIPSLRQTGRDHP